MTLSSSLWYHRFDEGLTLLFTRLIIMNVWTLTTDTFGEPRLLGVYEDAKGVARELTHISQYADPGDEFRIRFSAVETTKEVNARTKRCEERRREQLEEAVKD